MGKSEFSRPVIGRYVGYQSHQLIISDVSVGLTRHERGQLLDCNVSKISTVYVTGLPQISDHVPAIKLRKPPQENPSGFIPR